MRAGKGRIGKIRGGEESKEEDERGGWGGEGIGEVRRGKG